MQQDNFNERKKEILNKIFLKKEDTLAELEEIVNESLKHFSIDAETKRIVLKPHIKKINQKILLSLIGMFLMNEKGITSGNSISIAQISDELSIIKTSLSKPLGILINRGLIRKDEKGNYFIVHYKIKEILTNLKNE